MEGVTGGGGGVVGAGAANAGVLAAPTNLEIVGSLVEDVAVGGHASIGAQSYLIHNGIIVGVGGGSAKIKDIFLIDGMIGGVKKRGNNR